jgi:hypothetical protein
MMSSAPPKHHAVTTDILLIGAKTGRCDICKATKKVLLLKYGFTLCEECFNICICILQELQVASALPEPEAKPSTKSQTMGVSA